MEWVKAPLPSPNATRDEAKETLITRERKTARFCFIG